MILYLHCSSSGNQSFGSAFPQSLSPGGHFQASLSIVSLATPRIASLSPNALGPHFAKRERSGCEENPSFPLPTPVVPTHSI